MGKPPVFFEPYRATILRGVAVVTAATVICLAGPQSANAQDYEGARLLGLGRAQRALATSNDSIYVNPAGLALERRYVIESGYVDDFRGSDRRFNGSIVDGQAGPLAGGVAYTYTVRRPSELPEGNVRLEGHRAEVALATRLASEASIGVNVRYLRFERTDGDQVIDGSDFGIFNLDAGLQYRLAPNLSLGVAGYNLIKNDRPETPLQLGGGIGYQADTFLLEADFLYDFQVEDLQLSGSLELLLGDMFPVRGGVSWNQEADEWRLSVGIGMVLDQLSIDLAYRQSLNSDRPGDDADDRLFVVSLRAFVL